MINVNKARVVVLGAGFGGLELSTLISETFSNDVDVTLIDKNDAFVFGYSKLDVMFGRTTLEAVRLPYGSFVKSGVRFLQQTVIEIDPESRRVTTDGGTYEADFLIVALGADYDMETTRGWPMHILWWGGRATTRCAAHLQQGKGTYRGLRCAVQMPARAKRMRLDAARLPSQSRGPRGLRYQLRAAVGKSGTALARNLARVGGGFHRAQYQVCSRPPCGLCRRRPQGRNSR